MFDTDNETDLKWSCVLFPRSKYPSLKLSHMVIYVLCAEHTIDLYLYSIITNAVYWVYITVKIILS